MEDTNFKKYIDIMIKNGEIKIGKNGELEITKKGEKSGHAVLKEGVGREYLQKVVKHLKNSENKKNLTQEELIEEIEEIENTKLDFLERLKISPNDDLIGYQVFFRLCEALATSDSGMKVDGFDGVFEILKDAKYFSIPENIGFLLLNTKNRVTKTKLPYNSIFLDTSIIIYDRTYYGILLTDLTQIKEISTKQNVNTSGLEEGILATSFYGGESGHGWSKFNLYDKKSNKYIRKIQEYIMNVTCFLNSNDIKIIFRERTEKNKQRRIKNNRVALPSFNKIEVIGYLKKYLDKLESEEGDIKFTHRFWVRGHFRHFWNKKYDNLYREYKKGNLKEISGRQYMMDSFGSLKLWIYPYIKGSGILIEKKYNLS